MDQIKKKTSRDAARQRRGQQNDEYGELALQLPLPIAIVEKLDRLCIMRLSNSYIKIKHILHEIEEGMERNKWDVRKGDNILNSLIQEALGGFVFVLAEDGQILYVSSNVLDSLGLSQLVMTGQNIYKYVHPCDQENLALQLGGHVPLADMEIFDGLFCADAPVQIQIPKHAKGDFDGSSHRSFFLRMKSTLTSRGKSVNINASIHRVVQCTGTMQMYRMKLGVSDGSITRCFIGVGTPLLSSATCEVPIDRTAFIAKHSLNFHLIAIEQIGVKILGYPENTLLKTSWYKYCHICDINVLKNCHKILLQQGQSVSCYYRMMVRQGGWIWMETKANVVYTSSTRKPSYIICTHYTISGLELEGNILSLEQLTGLNKGKKRELPCERKVDTTEDNGPPTMKLKTGGESPVYEYNFSGEEERWNAVNFRMPLKTELEKKEDAPESCAGLTRAPTIPCPFRDVVVKLKGLGDEDATTEEASTMEKDESNAISTSVPSPSVPSPSIDRILNFDELSFPDYLDNYQEMIEFGDGSSNSGSFDESALELEDFGNVKIPIYLLLPEVVEMTTPPLTVFDGV